VWNATEGAETVGELCGCYYDATHSSPSLSLMSAELECPFCAIARGGDPSAKMLCGDASWVAFFPVAPATPGHTLVIPRNHVRDVWALSPDLGHDLMQGVVRVGRALQEVLQPEGMNLISSAGRAAEQTVFHLHLHVVPRWQGDGIGRIWPREDRMAEGLREDLAEAIRAACEAV
jgi:histidine triad (HIT) family protein